MSTAYVQAKVYIVTNVRLLLTIQICDNMDEYMNLEDMMTFTLAIRAILTKFN